MGGRILIVEDDQQNLYLTQYLLRAAGFEVFIALDGEAGVEMAERERPDLVLTDISLPKLDGLEVTRRIKSSPATKDVPVVALTAYSMKGDRETILEAGCDGYVSKPIEPDKLVELVRRFLPRESA